MHALLPHLCTQRVDGVEKKTAALHAAVNPIR
jgi:hypothetical protein